MRESIFEKYKKSKVDFKLECIKIRDLVLSHKSVFNQKYIKSNVNYMGVDFMSAISTITNFDFSIVPSIFNNHDNPIGKSNINLDMFLDILEFCKNVVIDYQINTNYCFTQLNTIIDINANKLGYSFKRNDLNQECLYVNNPLAESIAISSPKSLCDKIYEYLMIRKGDKTKKRNVLKSLSDDAEIICKKYVEDTKLQKIKQIMQCVRHPKETMKSKYPFFFDDEEKWEDKLFEMFLYCFSYENTNEYIKEFRKNEKK